MCEFEECLNRWGSPHTRESIKSPISVPVNPSRAVECYPCRKVPLNYSESHLFHGGNTGSTPVRDANILKNTSNLGIKEHLRSSSCGSSDRLFPTPAMVEVDLRSSSGEALKQLGYPFEDAAEVRSFTANRRAQVRGPAGPRPRATPGTSFSRSTSSTRCPLRR